MKSYKEFITEQINSDKHLIVVDVQKEFSNFIPEGMVEAISEYCNTFNNVYQIWDSNKAKSPSYNFPNQKETIVKKFGTKFSEELEKTVKELNQKYPDAKEGDMFDFDDVNSYVIRVKNNHGWFYVPENMARLFNTLKGKHVVLIGGAKSECIKDVFEALESFGIDVEYDNRYIYSAKNTNTQKYDINTQSSIS